jgi:hypothetical protein
MYAKPEDVEEYLNNSPKKPYILCEFMHDMGNSMGGLGSYMKLIDKYDMYHGGFIWDFIDQAIMVKDPVTGKDVLRYGGDVYADEIIVKYTYETITTPATTILVSYSVDASGKIRVDVHYNGVQGLPEFPVFGMRFIMPTLAAKYLYKGLSGETYLDGQWFWKS